MGRSWGKKDSFSFFIILIITLSLDAVSFVIQNQISQKGNSLALEIDQNIVLEKENSQIQRNQDLHQAKSLIVDWIQKSTNQNQQKQNQQEQLYSQHVTPLRKNIRSLSVLQTESPDNASRSANKPTPDSTLQNNKINEKEVSQAPRTILLSTKNGVNQSNIKGQSLNQIDANSFANILSSLDFTKFVNDLPIYQSESPQSQLSINTQSFDQVILNHNLPDFFVQSEFFKFSGKVKQNQLANKSQSRVVSVVFTDQFSAFKLVKTQKLPLNELTFSIQVQIPAKGKYKLSIIYGLSGDTNNRIFSVISNQFSTKIQKVNSTPNTQISKSYATLFEVKRNNLYLKISHKPDKTQDNLFPILLLKFKQYYSEQINLFYSNLNSTYDQIKIPYYKFEGFDEDLTSVEIHVGWSLTLSLANLTTDFKLISSQSFFATYHQFSEIKPEVLQLNSEPPFYIKQLGYNFKLTGKTQRELRNEIVVLEPPKTFKQYQINSFLKQNEKVAAGSTLNVSFLMDKQGTYIIQVNHADGYAVLNQPIYVGLNIYPLLPDFQDINPYETLDKVAPANKRPDQIKKQILNLINQKRRQFKQNPVAIDPKLSDIAQAHADDMSRRNYVSHYSPNGLGPVDRARNFGIYEEVSQNIALNTNIQDAHYRLCRSNIHLRNMVRPYWERIGLGIALNSQNAYIIVQEFSTRDYKTQPFTKEQIQSLKGQIVEVLMEMYPSAKSVNQTLSSDVSEYARLKRLNQTLQYQNLGEYLKSTNRYRKWAFSNLKVTYKSQGLVSVIKNQTYILPKNSQYTEIGISIQYLDGFLIMYFAFI